MLRILPFLAAATMLTCRVHAQGPPSKPKVTVSPVTAWEVQPTFLALGQVIPLRESRLGARTSGTVESVLVEEGDKVEQGQPLIRLETRVRQIRKQRALAELQLAEQQLQEFRNGSREEDVRAAKADWEEAKALRDDAVREVERLRELREESVVSDREFTAAEAAADRWTAQVELRRARYDQAVAGPRDEVIARAAAQVAVRQAELAEIEDELEKTQLFAPFAGVVTERLVEQGHFVSTGDAMISLVQWNPIDVEAAVPETAIDSVAADGMARVFFDALPDTVLQGALHRVIPRADSRARTFPVRIRLQNDDFRLLPGMSARVEIDLPAGGDSLGIPRDALIRTPSGVVVFVVREGKALRVEVEPGRSEGARVEVRGDLTESDVVVVRGNERLRPGQDVEILTPEPPSGAPQRPSSP